METALKHDNRCPACKDVQEVVRGNQPQGTMNFYKRSEHLPGYHDKRNITLKKVTKNDDVIRYDLNMQINAQPIQI